jgi:hypothetical protein
MHCKLYSASGLLIYTELVKLLETEGVSNVLRHARSAHNLRRGSLRVKTEWMLSDISLRSLR